MATVWCVQWEESERGWGVRPDGFSLHLTQKKAKDYVKQFMEQQRHYFEEELGPDVVPEEYTRPASEPYQVRVGDGMVKRLKAKKNNGSLLFGPHEPYPTPVNESDQRWVRI